MGKVLAITCSVPCLLAALCFYKAGLEYKKIKECMDKDKIKAMDVAVA